MTLAAAAWFASPSIGHGPTYPPPPPPPPTGYTGPPPVVYGGPGDGRGPSTPGPSGPAAPGPSGPATPGPSGPQAPKGGGPPSTAASTMPELSSWTWWWIYNQDPYLDLKQRVLSEDALTGSDDFFLGHGSREVADGAAATDEQFQEQVGPALQRVIEAETSDRILSDAMIALAKLHPIYVPSGERSMLELFSTHLDHPNQKVVESAVVAIGMMAEPACAPVLCDLAADTPAGRKLVRRSSVPGRTRPLAALSVGLIGARCEREDVRRYIVSRLVGILDGEREASPDLNVACVTSIGLSPLAPLRRALEEGASPRPSSSREGQIHYLCDLLMDKDRREYVRAHVPKALGLLAGGVEGAAKERIARAFIDTLGSRKKDKRLVRYGIVEGLGLLGDADADAIDVEIRKALHKSIQDGDIFQRQLSLLAIAFTSSRAGSGSTPKFSGTHAERAYLIQQLKNGNSRMQPWAALALGLQTFHCREGGGVVSPEIALTLRQTLSKVSSPDDVGAWCIALGLCGDLESAPDLHENLADLRDDIARGRVAIALGLLGDREAISPLEQIVDDSVFHPDLLRESSIALALLGNKQVAQKLVAVLGDNDSLAIMSAVVSALGYVGDKRTVDPLVALLDDDKEMDTSRSYAAVALGVICERDPLPWPALYLNHFNYAAATETLITADETGILNLR